MPQATSNIVQEARSALRGVLGLIVGDRQAGRWFDLTLRGLCGSFIALLVVTAVSDYLPVLMGHPGAMFRSFAIDALLTALQVGCSYIVLRQVGRPDGFVPYLTADTWATAVTTIVITALQLLGLNTEFLSLPVIVLVILLAVNIGRLIVGLPALQVAMLVIAQLVGAAIGLLAVGLLFPIPPAALGQ